MKISDVYNEKNEFVYVCAKSCTVDELCVKFLMKKEDFIFYNGMAERYEVGQEVFVKRIEGEVYRVKAGDSLKSIAKKYCVSEEKLLSSNGIRFIIPGQYLIIE